MKSRLTTYLQGEKSKLESKHCTVIGLGSLGSKTALHLSKMGLDLRLIDADHVEERNLDTQMYRKQDVGELKTKALSKIIKGFTGENVQIKTLEIVPGNVGEEIKDTDIIIDATDNLETRLLLNDHAKKNEIPLVSGMVGGSRGMLLTINKNSPCLKCVLGEKPQSKGTCDDLGMSPGLTEALSGLQVKHTVKQLLGEPFQDLHSLDIEKGELETIKTKERGNCPTCNGNYEELEPRK